MGVADFAHELPRILDENGSERSRATIGRVELLPGSANTVPGEARFSLDVRDPDETVMDELADAIRKALTAISRRRQLAFTYEAESWIHPVDCEPRMVELLERSAREQGLRYRRMISGAAHDAQIVASVCPVAMIFVPSQGGRSHSPAEWTAWDDIEAGAGLMLKALEELAFGNSGVGAIRHPG
jgi:N-carbamoyl-L-amino-acid hydrolase